MKKLTKRFLAVFTAVALLCSMALVANAETLSEENASVKTYTVQLGQATGVWYYFLHNATPTDGPVTLKYTVSEVKVALDDGNIGVVASTDANTTYPYKSGAAQFIGNAGTTSTLLTEGRTYTMVVGQNSDGTLSYSVTYVDDVNATSGSIDLPTAENNASDAQFFGLYGSCTTVVKLTGVSCVDANGNDLGVALGGDIGGEPKSNCSITEEGAGSDPDTPPVQDLTPASDAAAKHYTVQLGDTNGVYYYFLRNENATNGPITLRYTVSALDWRWTDPNDQHMGVVAAKNGYQNAAAPEGENPYQFTRDTDSLMTVGRTYTMVIGRNADGTIAYSVTYTDAENATPVAVYLSDANRNTATDAQFFGLYSNRTVVATLTKVSCVDSTGKDLGVALNANMGGDNGANINNCSITDEALIPGSDEDARRFTVQLGDTNGVYYYFLRNEKATDGPITLRYTVSKVDWKYFDAAEIGIVATTEINKNRFNPQMGGPYRYTTETDNLMIAGCTYTVVISRNADGTIIYSVTYTEAGSATPVAVNLPLANNIADANAQFFGLFSSRTVVATLTNVSCVDSAGNDLGVALNDGMMGEGENINNCFVKEEGTPAVQSVSLTLNKGVTVNVTIDITEKWLARNPGARVVFSNGTTIDAKAGQQVYSVDLTPAQINDDLTVEIANGLTATDVSVTTYRAKALAAGYPETGELIKLIDAALVYSDAADGAGKTLENTFDGVPDLGNPSHADENNKLFTSIDGKLSTYASIRISVNTTTYVPENVTLIIKVDGKEIYNGAMTGCLVGDYIVINNLCPRDFNKIFRIEAEGSSTEFTFNSYLKAVYGSTTNQQVKNFVVATYQYGLAAQEYMGTVQ